MLLIDTEEGRSTNKLEKNLKEAGNDYSEDDFYEDFYGEDESSDEDDDDYGFYPNEDDKRRPRPRPRRTKKYRYNPELSASTCRPRRGVGNDVTLNVTCGDRVIIDCDLPSRGSCISR